MLSEVTHLQDVVANLCTLSQDPSCLPDSAEEAISDALHDVVQPPATLEQKVGTVTVSHYITLRVDNLVFLPQNFATSYTCQELHFCWLWTY